MDSGIYHGTFVCSTLCRCFFNHRSTARLASVAAFVLVFAAAWLAQYFVRSLLTAGIEAAGLGGVNRRLGGIFGAVRGVLVVTLVVLVCAFTDLPQTADWRNAFSAPFFETLATFAVPYLPDFLAEKVQYKAL